MDSDSKRKRVRRVEVFLTRIDGDYPPLTFKAGESNVPFIRGRLWLEGDAAEAEAVSVSVPDNSEYVPADAVVPVVDNRVMIRLVPRNVKEEEAGPEAPEGGWAEVPEAEYFDDDSLQPEGKASKATMWILAAACMVCVAVLAWYFMYGRGGETGVAADSDSIKADTVQTDTARKADTLPAPEAAAPASPAPSYGAYGSYSSYTPEPDTVSAPEQRERKPRYEDYTIEGEH